MQNFTTPWDSLGITREEYMERYMCKFPAPYRF